MTTSQTSQTLGVERTDARRRRRAAAVAAVLAFALVAGTIWQLSASASSAVTLAAPPELDPSPVAAPAPDAPASRPDLPPPADHPADDAVTPPTPKTVEPPAEPAKDVAPAVTTPGEQPPAPDDEPATPPDEPDELPAPDAEPAGPAAEPAEPVSRPAPDPVDLSAVQSRLRELGYLLGPADGVRGQQTVAAIMAFQRVNGLSVDGVVGPRTLAALESPAPPQLRGSAATRIEVDLTRQLAHVVRDGTRVVTLHVSSGNGEAYRSSSGGTAHARTPVGSFRVERRIHGERHAALGVLYDPLYFHGGYAIHGSNSVPASPASHGCVRVTRADARWLIANIGDGTPVELYGGTHVFTPSR